MEPDRYKQNHTLYIFGMCFLAISFCLFAFCMYIFPHLVFNWLYDVPEFISQWRDWLNFNYGYTERVSSLLIFLFFFFLAVAFAVLAYSASNYIDDKIYRDRTEPRTEETLIAEEESRMWGTLMKVAIVVLVAILVVVFIDWVIYHPPHPQVATP